MITAGCLSYNAEGRVLVSVGVPVINFNGGTPIAADGSVVVAEADPDVFLIGLGYKADGTICARDTSSISGYGGGLARDSVGGLALALTGPITDYTAGIPLVDDGRVAVAFTGVPPAFDGYTNGFSDGFA